MYAIIEKSGKKNNMWTKINLNEQIRQLKEQIIQFF